MESTNAKIRLQQHQDETASRSSRPCSSLSTSDSSLFFASYSSNCTDYDYEHQEIRTQSEKKKRVKRPPVPKPSFMFFPDIKNTKSLETNKALSKKTQKSKTENELLKDYCPYSSDNCGCSSGCTDCDYGLYTYTTKNKSKLKSKGEKFCIKPSSSFRPLVSFERSRKTAKSFSAINILRKKKAKLPKIEKALDSCYPESSGSCNRQSNNIKHNFKLKTTKDQKPKTKKKTLAKNLRKLKTMRIVRTLKLRKNKKVSKNATVKVSERTVMKNWFPDSSNNYECNSDHTDCGKRIITIKRKKLKSKSRRAKTSTKSKMSELPSVIDEPVKNEKNSKQTAGIRPEKHIPSWSSKSYYSESDSYYTGEDC